jgi:flagellin
LTATATNAHDQTEIVGKNKLSDLVFGQVDDNNDGTIDNDDKIGLLSSRDGATKAMDIVESAIKTLDGIRADLGSAQNQLVVTVNNISVTQVNVRAAESQIRDVDFAAESANFSKYNILAQSGSYAMSQANAVQQNVLKLLQ